MANHEMFPYLCVHDAGKAIAFYTETFGMRELFRLTEPSERIGHAELDFHGATLPRCTKAASDGSVECRRARRGSRQHRV